MKKPSRLLLLATLSVIVFLYLPLVLVVVDSFNDARFGGVWRGFTLKWYVRLFGDRRIWAATANTLIVAGAATAASLVLGTLAAFALHRHRGRLQRGHSLLVGLPLIMPDILMGISLLLLFSASGWRRGLGTIFIAHVTFCISYVTMVMMARLQDFDFATLEAARDLGASWPQALGKVLLPQLLPGLLAAGLIAFTLSLDDFVITFFVSGSGSATLPLYIYSTMRHGAPALINALSAIFLVLTFVIVIVARNLMEKADEETD